nr:MAG TPA: hypothetical protein [Caudoviricetes sp.]
MLAFRLPKSLSTDPIPHLSIHFSRDFSSNAGA